ncbi:hypothetical protein HMI55_006813 [Coelomomyces lativittatus]|nr:hypothetical protein HMI56_003938 [Coelomomyces lativittatus]KAJ1510869.1 hypothetical protein HMI55_006813 [Coelomomyces lativittatus]
MPKLVSSDNQVVQVSRTIAERSVLLKNMMDDIPSSEDAEIPITNVTHRVLKKVLEYCEHHKDDPMVAPEQDFLEERRASDDIDDWDAEYINVDQEFLFEIIMAANYLDIEPLLDLGCKTVANIIKGKSPEEIRKVFNIQNDFTPEEEAQIRRENEWAEDR